MGEPVSILIECRRGAVRANSGQVGEERSTRRSQNYAGHNDHWNPNHELAAEARQQEHCDKPSAEQNRIRHRVN
jgi:hypothetical protein